MSLVRCEPLLSLEQKAKVYRKAIQIEDPPPLFIAFSFSKSMAYIRVGVLSGVFSTQ